VKAEKLFTAKRPTRALYGAGRVRRTQPFSGCLGGCQRGLVRSEIASLAFGLAPLLLLKLCHSHGNRQLLRQCFGNVRRHDELHRDGFWSHLRERDRGSQDHAPVQRMSRGHFHYSQIERRLTFKFDAHRWPLGFGTVQMDRYCTAPPHAPATRIDAATVLQQKRLGSLQLSVLILPAKGPNLVHLTYRTRTILDARGRPPDVPVK